MTDTEILNFIKTTVQNHGLTYGSILFSKKNKHISEYIYKNTEFLNIIPNIKNATRVYCLIHEITEIPKCKICGAQILRNIKPNVGFAKYCSAKCENNDPEVIAKLKKTNMAKYQSEWSFQSKNNKIKSKKTMLEKYGVEYAQQNNIIHEKADKTRLLRYGSKSPMSNQEIKQRAIRASRRNQFNRICQNTEIKPCFTESEYIQFGVSHIYTWKCARCGNIFESAVDKSWFKQGQDRQYTRCENCFPRTAGTSSGQIEIEDFIKTIYDGKIIVRSRCLGSNEKKNKNLEIDIFLPELMLGFEYDGLYFHSEKFGKGRNYHLAKTELAEKNGITLIHIFESEWYHSKDIVKSRIQNLLGFYNKTIFARKCAVKIVDPQTSQTFLNDNHIQGNINSSVNIGLYAENELISLMTFGKCRFDKKYEWEMLRFCCKRGYHIPGAAGKLLKYFERTYHPISLISYADRRWSVGNLYYRLGFELINKSKPNYWYFKSGFKLMSRMVFQKHKLKNILQKFDESKTEKQNMFDNGYNCIYDAGNLVFLKKYI